MPSTSTAVALGGDYCGHFDLSRGSAPRPMWKRSAGLCEVGPKRRELKLKLNAISTFLAPQLMRSDEVPLAIFRDAVFLKCLRVRNHETTFLLREMNVREGRDTMAVEDGRNQAAKLGAALAWRQRTAGTRMNYN